MPCVDRTLRERRAKKQIQRAYPPPPEVDTDDPQTLRMYDAWLQSRNHPEPWRSRLEAIGLKWGWLWEAPNGGVHFCLGRPGFSDWQEWVQHIHEEGWNYE